MKKFLILFSLLASYCVSAQAPEEERPNRPKEFLPDNTRPLDKNSIYSLSMVDSQPEFPGGMKAMYQFISDRYALPPQADVMNRVVASFVVEKNGKLSGVKTVRDIGNGYGEELVRVLKLSPKWKPAKRKGKKVRVAYYVTYVISSKD